MKKIYFYDCGAWDGAETDIFVSICQKHNIPYKVFMFEPCPPLFKKLLSKYFTNDNIILFDCAISDIKENRKLFISFDTAHQGNSIFPDKNNVTECFYSVPCVPLSSFITEGVLNLVKFNIEGAEYLMMNDLIRTGKNVHVSYFFGSTPDMGKVESLKNKLDEYRDMLHRHEIKVHPFFYTDNETEMKKMVEDFEKKILSLV